MAEKNRELWIWGNRLLDGKTTGLGMREAAMNNTHRAIDMIPKDVVIEIRRLLCHERLQGGNLSLTKSRHCSCASRRYGRVPEGISLPHAE
ncbi:MAG: hypothetical protein OEV74_21405 [Cyclobacteriaceae bacterium]|nr:hypothetical protein [Cyclobacteriaceae bacterium]MDH4298842.1 hypothetical protein [Cyclobacteriaceae bacterium]MDH5248349.1 hypothetical protein [Cyclobacteriaceae bacterium]